MTWGAGITEIEPWGSGPSGLEVRDGIAVGKVAGTLGNVGRWTLGTVWDCGDIVLWIYMN